MKYLIAALLFAFTAPPQIAALPPLGAVDAGEPFSVWVVVFGEGDISTTVPSVVELIGIEERTPAGMTGMRWRRYSYRVDRAGIYALDYTACGAGGCASARATVYVGQQVYLPAVGK